MGKIIFIVIGIVAGIGSMEMLASVAPPKLEVPDESDVGESSGEEDVAPHSPAPLYRSHSWESRRRIVHITGDEEGAAKRAVDMRYEAARQQEAEQHWRRTGQKLATVRAMYSTVGAHKKPDPAE